MAPYLERNQLAGAFLDVNKRLHANASNTLEAASLVYSLVELLSGKGLISIDELDARQATVTSRFEQRMQRERPTVQLQDPCTIREHRPLPCRGYDCRKDQRIWLDYEAHTINPRILQPGCPCARSARRIRAPQATSVAARSSGNGAL